MNKNPFTPNFGDVPQYIIGRDQVLSDVFGAMEDPEGNPARTSIFVGARGTGKTALLSYFSERSKQWGWISVNTTCIEGLQEDIIQQTVMAAQEFLPQKKRRQLSGISIGQIIGFEWDNEKETSANWRTRMTQILRVLAESGVGLLLTIDEVTPRLPEMIQVASIYQLFVREKRKIALLMAGLSSEVSSLLNDRAVSFLRRASQFSLGRIDDYEVKSAFSRMVRESGKNIEPDALKKAVEAIDGFPYMLQLVGYRAWQLSEAKKRINGEIMQDGIELARQDFESRVLRATVSELSEGDRAFLAAMLQDKAVSNISDIVKRLKKSPSYVANYRARLIERGIIAPVGRGRLEFALPGMHDYLEK